MARDTESFGGVIGRTDQGSTRPFDCWPAQRGFDRWYSLPGGYTDQWHPELYDGTTPVDLEGGEGYHLTDDLIDHAVEYVRDQQSVAPERPFFLYVALGACHWPHQAPKKYIEKYRGRYDAGWDAARESWLARQKQLGIVPADVELPPGDPAVPAWDTLTPDEQRLAARHMEVYAGFLEHTDAQIGRLIDYLEQVDALDNTLIMLISDNGASGEGGRMGCVNVDYQFQGRMSETVDMGLEALDRLGDETTNAHYPMGWAQAGNTPLKWYKTDVHGGGVRDPLIVHWPAGVQERGGLRDQYHHVVDLVPTVLELIGVEAPSDVKGVPQLPIQGTSLAYTLAERDAPTRKQTQYYEMIGDRALWHLGWKAVVLHESGEDFEADRWELYHLAEDYAELHDLAEQEPGRLRELIERWWAEAGANNVQPLDDRRWERAADGWQNRRTQFVYRPGMARIERWNTPNVTNRSFSIEADVETPEGGAEGVLLAVGSRFGGYALYVQDGRLTFDYNAGHAVSTIRSERPIVAGRRTLGFEFAKTGQLQGRGTLLVDGVQAGVGDLERTWPINPARAGLHCGRDGGSQVSPAYACPFTFTGTLHRVIVTLGDDQRRDPAAERRAAQAED